MTEEPKETTPIVEEHTESTPAATVPGESAESTPAPQDTEENGKAAHTGQGLEEEPRLSAGADSGIAQTGLAHDATGESLAAMVGSPTSPPTVGGPEAQASATSALAAGARAAMTAAQRAGAMSCELAGLGGRSTDNCTVGWLGAKRLLTTSVTLEPVASSLAVAAAAALPGGGGRGGSAGGNSPASPTPGPAPGGASGTAVGGGGAPGGGALSIFLTLAGLLLLGGPRAMRRLRLSHRPWLTACFVLIPERPG